MSFTVATFQFNNDKNCFATLPNECFNRIPKHTEIAVFEVTPNDGPCIYVSCKNKQSVSRGDKIILNGLFGSKLGLKDGEQVIIRHLTSVPSCSQLSVEPVSVDDWEILERHAAFVESNVMDQVRVVWKGQVFPVWVEKSICLFLKIGVTEPGANCVILNNETEVIVLPKLRTETKSQKTSHFNPPAKKPDYFPANELDDYKMQNFDPPDDELDNSRGRNKKWSGDKISPSKWNLKDWLPWLLGGQQSNENESGKFIPDTGQGLVKSDRRLSIDNTQDSLENGLNFTFRIQSLMVNFDTKDNKHSDLDGDDEDVYSSLQDATSVFVNREDVLAQLGNKNAYVPEIFLAKLKKLPSPKDQLVEIEKQLSNQKKDTSKSTDKKSTEKLSEKKSESSKDKMIEAVVKVIVIDKKRVTADEHRQELLSCLLSEQQCHRGHVIISGLLRRLLKLDVTSRIWLQVTDAVPANPSKYEIHPVGSVPISITSQLIQMALRNWVKRVTTKKMPLIVFHGVAVKFPIITDTHMEFQITIADSNIMRPEVTYPFGVMHPGNLNEVPLHVVTNTRSSSDQPKWPVQNMLQYTDVSSIDPLVPTMQLDHLGDISQYTAEALCHIEVCLGMKPLSDAMFRQNTPGLRNGLLLITGNKGSGKSSFAKGLCRKVAEPPNLAYISHVDCKPLRGKRPDSILKLFEAVFDEASWRQPSVILLDDLDHVAPSPSGPEAELSGEAVYGSRVAEVIRDILRRDIANGARIAVIATSHSRSTIHPLLVNSRGTHFVQKVVSIIPPDKDGREKILRTIIHNRPRISAETIDNIDWHWLRNKTEGYVASDLDTLLSRALHAHSISNDPNTINSETVVLTHTDIMNALEGFTPASIRNVPLHTAGELGWEDVGGLTDVKSILQETLLWPSKYPLLFSSCSLRLRSGLLLYGAPGTGKTLLAGVLAKECQLNFISIKGPELLSKYIGASEQAVRDNFLRAQSAKPCILFFDEFDSIAPRRGHDNTGVTDRVVNQLLTQLDGVEGLDGVYVLAATSRPDLIDPALLRPGRLDKCLECKIPSKEERLKIFESLTRKMSIASSVDFTYFAGKCEYFTGADIKALLYNAQLEAIHEVTGKLLKEDNSMLKKNAQGGKRKHSKQISPRKSQTCMTLKKNVTVDRNMINQKVLYIPKLEEGISVISEEMEENLNSQVEHIQTRLKVNKLTEHTSTSENMFSPVATAKSHLVQVNQSHLLKALEKTRPSVNQQERNRYKKIYENFISSRGGNFGETPVENAKRQTLA